MTESLNEVQSKIAVVFEDGYFLENLRFGIEQVVLSLLGKNSYERIVKKRVITYLRCREWQKN